MGNLSETMQDKKTRSGPLIQLLLPCVALCCTLHNLAWKGYSEKVGHERFSFFLVEPSGRTNSDENSCERTSSCNNFSQFMSQFSIASDSYKYILLQPHSVAASVHSNYKKREGERLPMEILSSKSQKPIQAHSSRYSPTASISDSCHQTPPLSEAHK